MPSFLELIITSRWQLRRNKPSFLPQLVIYTPLGESRWHINAKSIIQLPSPLPSRPLFAINNSVPFSDHGYNGKEHFSLFPTSLNHREINANPLRSARLICCAVDCDGERLVAPSRVAHVYKFRQRLSTMLSYTNIVIKFKLIRKISDKFFFRDATSNRGPTERVIGRF